MLSNTAHQTIHSCKYLQESSIFMRGFVKMGVMGAEGTVWGDWGGVTTGEGMEGLPEVLPSASFPFSLYRGAPAKEMKSMQQKYTWWHQQKSKCNITKWRNKDNDIKSISNDKVSRMDKMEASTKEGEKHRTQGGKDEMNDVAVEFKLLKWLLLCVTWVISVLMT